MGCFVHVLASKKCCWGCFSLCRNPVRTVVRHFLKQLDLEMAWEPGRAVQTCFCWAKLPLNIYENMSPHGPKMESSITIDDLVIGSSICWDWKIRRKLPIRSTNRIQQLPSCVYLFPPLSQRVNRFAVEAWHTWCMWHMQVCMCKNYIYPMVIQRKYGTSPFSMKTYGPITYRWPIMAMFQSYVSLPQRISTLHGFLCHCQKQFKL